MMETEILMEGVLLIWGLTHQHQQDEGDFKRCRKGVCVGTRHQHEIRDLKGCREGGGG